MSAKNNCTFIGNLGSDVETRVLQSGTVVAQLSIPIESGYGDKKRTTWVRAALFGKRAEGKLIGYLKKGQTVSVPGEIYLDEYTNKRGEEKVVLNMMVNDIALIGRANSQNEEQKAPTKDDPFGAGDGDDIPF